MTSPMERDSSTIAPRHEELEAADHHLVARIQVGDIHPGVVHVCPVGRTQVLDLQFLLIGIEAAVLTGNRDIVEEDVGFRVAARPQSFRGRA